MTGWLKTWGKDVPTPSKQDGSSDGDTGGMDMGSGNGSGNGSQMNTGDLDRLDKAHGAAWDHTFLTMMIAHHEGAIEMAKTEQAHGENPDAIALAKTIEAAQTTEIPKMKDMLNR